MDNRSVEAQTESRSKGKKIKAKRARRDMLATYIWKEEAAENGGAGYDEEQKER